MRRYLFKKRVYRWIFRWVDSIGDRVFGHRGVPIPDAIERILIVRLDHLGDLVLSMPAIEAVRKKFPRAHIALLAHPSASQILPEGWVDEMISFEAPWFSKDRRRIFSWNLARDLAARLKRGRYQIGIELRGDARQILLLRWAGIPVRIGYGATGLGFLLTHEAEVGMGIHEVDRTFELLKILGIERPVALGTCRLRSSEGPSVAEELERLGIDGRHPLVCLLPGAAEERKRWPLERLAEVGKDLAGKCKAHLVIAGESAERGLGETLAKSLGVSATNLVGRTTLGTLRALLVRSDLAISMDSGAAHLAAALGTPVITLFTQDHAPEQWRPWGPSAVCLWKPDGLSAIQAEEVIQEAHKILRHKEAVCG